MSEDNIDKETVMMRFKEIVENSLLQEKEKEIDGLKSENQLLLKEMDQFKARLSDLYTAVKTEKLEKIFATEMMSTKQEIERLWSEIYNLQANIQQLQTSEQILKITKTKLENDIVMKDDILKQKD